MPTPRPVAFVSRQRLVGRTNGSSIYLLNLAATSCAESSPWRRTKGAGANWGKKPLLSPRHTSLPMRHRVGSLPG